jgi:hypothetical protein
LTVHDDVLAARGPLASTTSFSVETAGDSPVWAVTEIDVLSGARAIGG